MNKRIHIALCAALLLAAGSCAERTQPEPAPLSVAVLSPGGEKQSPPDAPRADGSADAWNLIDYALDTLRGYAPQIPERINEKTADEIETLLQKYDALCLAVERGEGTETALDNLVESLHRIALYNGVFSEDWEEVWVEQAADYALSITGG